MSFTRVDKYFERSSVDPRYTIAAVCLHGQWKFEAWFKERVALKTYRSHQLAVCDTAEEARKAAIEHKLMAGDAPGGTRRDCPAPPPNPTERTA